MKITKLSAKNFRRHVNLLIPFETDTTVLVGENDAGKTSVIDALKIILLDNPILVDDFHQTDLPIEIEVYFDDGKSSILHVTYESAIIKYKKYVSYDARQIAILRGNLDEKEEAEIKLLCREFGISIGSSKKETLSGKLKEVLSDRSRFKLGRYTTEVSKFANSLNIYFLDGKSFEEVNKFVHDTFFKEKQNSLWDEQIPEIMDGDMTISGYIQNRIDSYRDKIEAGMHEHDFVSKLQKYIPDLKELKITTFFEKRDLNLAVQVMFQVGDVAREAKRFGDGTRRRITMALLQHKIESETSSAFYVFDEPDTHLHPKAQSDLLDIMDEITTRTNQILISTHSPFIMNSAQLRQIRLLEKSGDASVVRRMSDERIRTSSYSSLGVENSHLFFSRKIVIVEGKTEQAFFPRIYQRFFNRPMGRDFIRIIPREGIEDAVRFIEVIQEFSNHSDLLLVTDNDASSEIQQIIDGLRIPVTNQFVLGRREFEDSFGSQVIYNAWKKYVEGQKKDISLLWNAEAIFELLQESGDAKGKAKFSERLSELNKGCLVGMTKPKMGEALGEYCLEQHLDPSIKEFLNVIRR